MNVDRYISRCLHFVHDGLDTLLVDYRQTGVGHLTANCYPRGSASCHQLASTNDGQLLVPVVGYVPVAPFQGFTVSSNP